MRWHCRTRLVKEEKKKSPSHACHRGGERRRSLNDSTLHSCGGRKTNEDVFPPPSSCHREHVDLTNAMSWTCQHVLKWEHEQCLPERKKTKRKGKITQSIVKGPWRKEDGRNIRKVNPHPVGLQTLRRRPSDSITRHKTSGVFFWGGGMVMSGMGWGGVCVCFEAGSYTPQPSRSLKCCSGLVGETLRSSTSNIHSTETPKP